MKYPCSFSTLSLEEIAVHYRKIWSWSSC